MSDVISAWVDSDEVRRLAESLLTKPSEDKLNQLEVEFGSQFEGYAVSSSADSVSPKLGRPSLGPSETSTQVAAETPPAEAAAVQPSESSSPKLGVPELNVPAFGTTSLAQPPEQASPEEPIDGIEYPEEIDYPEDEELPLSLIHI